jgi:alpha-ketoglutarate-dependent taurine dioxygenase
MDDLPRRISELPADKLTLLIKAASLKSRSTSQNRISPQERDGRWFPLSFAQQRLWFLDRMDNGGSFYNESLAVRLTGSLNCSALTRSINEIVRRHEILRTTFPMCEGEPLQVIAPAWEISLPLIDLRGLDPVGRLRKRDELIVEQTARSFDLAHGPLLRVKLLRSGDAEHILLLTMHHIVSDAWSTGILVHELTTLYRVFSIGRPSPLPKLPIQYADFAYWQRRVLPAEVLEEQSAYWRKSLAGAPAFLHLPTDRPYGTAPRRRGMALPFVLPSSLVVALKELSHRESVTQFIILLSAFLCLLFHYTKSDDIVVGADVANRHHGETEGLIGFFVNMLALRVDLSGDPTFRELLARVRKVVLDAYTHQDLPFERLVEDLRPTRDPRYTPIFQVVFDYYPFEELLEAPGLKIEILDVEQRTARFDLSLLVIETKSELKGSLRFSTDLFEQERICRWLECYDALLRTVTEQPDVRLSTLLILTDREREQQVQQNRGLKRANFKRFVNTTPKTIGASQGRLVQTSSLPPGEGLPLLVTPSVGGLDLAHWIETNREHVDGLLLKHGALLFRRFDVSTPAEFRRIATAFSGELLNYNEPSSPRSRISENIYTSTEYPADQWIQLHNEMSYTSTWPQKVFFFCSLPAESGGETPLAYSRKVFELLSPKLREKFVEKGVMYVRNFGDGLDLPWQHVFQSADRAEVDRYCNAAGIEVQWKDGNRLRTRQVCPAIVTHPRRGETVWFNQAHAFHGATLEPALRRFLLEEMGEEEIPRNAYYGDGSRIEDSVIDEIREVYRQVAETFTWQTGDVLILDNITVAHGRAPFTGTRKVLVAMAEPYTVRPG